MRKFIVFVIIGLAVVFLLIISFNFYNSKVEIQLDRCVDGDTAWFLIDGKREKVRFLGIDTPESVHPNGVVEEYGVDASDYTCDMLKKADHIYLEYDSNSDRYDRYGRVLGWVFVGDQNLSELLLAIGYARVEYVYGDYKYIDKLCEVQKQAYLDRLGIWKVEYDKYQENYCMKG